MAYAKRTVKKEKCPKCGRLDDLFEFVWLIWNSKGSVIESGSVCIDCYDDVYPPKKPVESKK